MSIRPKAIDRAWLNRTLNDLGYPPVQNIEVIQTLWGGYGVLARLCLCDASRSTPQATLQSTPQATSRATPQATLRATSQVIATANHSIVLKYICPPRSDGREHPRGFGGAQSHRRKIRSYIVEANFYDRWADDLNRLGDVCRVAQPIAIDRDSPNDPIDQTRSGDGMRLFLEDLDASGFDGRPVHPTDSQIELVLDWLAAFHARTLTTSVDDGSDDDSLWPIGTYWHLDTRPDEWSALALNDPHRVHGRRWDAMLNGCQYRCLVHGDAKIANFCFDDRRGRVAAVDFQYVGFGCGIKDVMYFMTSCMDDRRCRECWSSTLNRYFDRLSHYVAQFQIAVDIRSLRSEWERLFPIAWADFNRFLRGWCPDHAKLTPFAQEMTSIAISRGDN